MSATREFELRTRHELNSVHANFDLAIGVIRIPKCASSTAVHALGARSPIDFSEALSLDLEIVAAVRDPVARLLSSIPETLFRSTPDPQKYAGDILVSEEEYEEIMKLRGNEPLELARAIFERITGGGFFEIHHLPMFPFIFHSDGRARGPIRIYRADQSSVALRALLAARGVDGFAVRSDLRKNDRTIHSGPEHNTLGRQLKKSLARLRGAVFPAFSRRYPPNHPILRLANSASPLSSFELGETLKGIYRVIRSDVLLVEEARRVVQHTYASDLRLFNEVLRSPGVFVSAEEISFD